MDHSSGLVFRRPQATLTADLWSIFAPPFSLPSVSVGIVKLRPELAEADDEPAVGAWAWIGRELAIQNTRRH